MLNPAILGTLIPIVALTIPIVAILTAHQRKMAEIIHQNRQPSGEIDALRHEIRELRSLVHQQSISLDDIRSRQAIGSSQPTTEIRERLTGS